MWLHNTAAILDNPQETLLEYIVDQKLPIHDPKPFILPRQSNATNLYYAPSGTASTTLVADRDPITGRILEFIEVELDDAECTAKNSMSMHRAPVRPEQATRGSATNFPFWPGGFDEPAKQIESLKLDNSEFVRDFLTIAPGFNEGLEFDTDADSGNVTGSLTETTESVDLLSIVEDEHNVLGMWSILFFFQIIFHILINFHCFFVSFSDYPQVCGQITKQQRKNQHQINLNTTKNWMKLC